MTRCVRKRAGHYMDLNHAQVNQVYHLLGAFDLAIQWFV